MSGGQVSLSYCEIIEYFTVIDDRSDFNLVLGLLMCFLKTITDVIIILMVIHVFVCILRICPNGNCHCHSSKSIFILSINAVQRTCDFILGDTLETM